jgi:hypothetical protein
MPIVMRAVFQPDDFDMKMRDDGYLTDVEAADELGRPVGAIPGMVRSGALLGKSIQGRTYVSVDSICNVIRAVGLPSAREQRLEHLRATGRGNGQEAVGIQESIARSMAEQDVVDGVAGIWGGRSDVEVVRNVKAVPADDRRTLGGQFLALFGKAGK